MELVGKGAAELGELLVLLVADVVAEDVLELGDEADELVGAGVDALQLLHRRLELLVLRDVVLDRLGAVLEVLAHGGVDVHLLGHAVPNELADDGVGEIAPLLGVGADLDLLQEVERLPVVGGQDVDLTGGWTLAEVLELGGGRRVE